MTREELKQEAEELIQRFEMANSMNCYMSLTPDRKQIGEMLVMIAEPREKRIAEQEELLNSTLEENKDIYKKMADLDTALEDCTESLTDARIKIKELEKENEELNDKLNNLSKVAEVRLANWQKYEKENEELRAKIEKMKLCQNCKFEDNDCIEEPCSACTRCLGNVKRKGNSDKWELQEG